MKKNNRLRLLAFVLVAVVFLAAAVPAYAAMVAKNIEVYSGVKIFLNGREMHPTDVRGNSLETFIYEGTTYVPLRAVSEALGAEVSWNGEEKYVYLNTDGIGGAPEERFGQYDAGSGPISYTCGPMELSSEYCTAQLDGFTVVDSWVAMYDPYYAERVRVYELYTIITGTLKSSQRGYFLCYANCYDENGILLRTEKITQEMEENVPFKIRYPLDVPADTVRIVLTADRMD